MVLWLKLPAAWEFVWEIKQLALRFLKDLVGDALRTKKPAFLTETEGFKLVYGRKKTKVMTKNFFMWYPPRDLSVESIPNRKSKILQPPLLSRASQSKIQNLKSKID